MAHRIRQLATKSDGLSSIQEPNTEGCPLTMCIPLWTSPQQKWMVFFLLLLLLLVLFLKKKVFLCLFKVLSITGLSVVFRYSIFYAAQVGLKLDPPATDSRVQGL